jgi:hypothetical protein
MKTAILLLLAGALAVPAAAQSNAAVLAPTGTLRASFLGGNRFRGESIRKRESPPGRFPMSSRSSRGAWGCRRRSCRHRMPLV